MKRPMSHARRFMLNVTVIFGFLFALGALGGMMKSCEDHSEEWAVSQSRIDAQNDASKELRKDKAAQDLCLATVGQSSAAWTTDGELICTPRKGKK